MDNDNTLKKHLPLLFVDAVFPLIMVILLWVGIHIYHSIASHPPTIWFLRFCVGSLTVCIFTLIMLTLKSLIKTKDKTGDLFSVFKESIKIHKPFLLFNAVITTVLYYLFWFITNLLTDKDDIEVVEFTFDVAMIIVCLLWFMVSTSIIFDTIYQKNKLTN